MLMDSKYKIISETSFFIIRFGLDGWIQLR
jgi:hypothetical protein